MNGSEPISSTEIKNVVEIVSRKTKAGNVQCEVKSVQTDVIANDLSVANEQSEKRKFDLLQRAAYLYVSPETPSATYQVVKRGEEYFVIGAPC